MQRLSNAAWVVQLGNPRMKELQDALAVLRVDSVDFSTLQAMTFHDVLQRDGLLFTAMDTFQRAFSQIRVLEIL